MILLSGQINLAINKEDLLEFSDMLEQSDVFDTTEEIEEDPIESLRTEKEDLETKLNDVNNQIVYIQSELTTLLYEIEELNLQILNNEEEIETLKAEELKIIDFVLAAEVELEKITLKYEKQKALLEKRLVAMYKTNDITYLDVLVNSRSISEFISNYYLISELVEADEKFKTTTVNSRIYMEQLIAQLLLIAEEGRR